MELPRAIWRCKLVIDIVLAGPLGHCLVPICLPKALATSTPAGAGLQPLWGFSAMKVFTNIGLSTVPLLRLLLLSCSATAFTRMNARRR